MLGNKEQVLKYLEKDKDGDIYDISKKQTKSIRSLAQNKYRWAVVIDIISNWSGDSTLSTHYGLKSMFKLETTTDLSTDEFKFMIEAIRDLFKTNYNVVIPNPNDIAGEDSLYKSLGF